MKTIWEVISESTDTVSSQYKQALELFKQKKGKWEFAVDIKHKTLQGEATNTMAFGFRGQ